jgi:hypothetical protein
MTAETCRACESETKISKINALPRSVHDKIRSDQLTDKTGSPMSPKRRTSRVCGIRISAGQQDIACLNSVKRKKHIFRLNFSFRKPNGCDSLAFCTVPVWRQPPISQFSASNRNLRTRVNLRFCLTSGRRRSLTIRHSPSCFARAPSAARNFRPCRKACCEAKRTVNSSA